MSHDRSRPPGSPIKWIATVLILSGMLVVWLPAVEHKRQLLFNLAVSYLAMWGLVFVVARARWLEIAMRFGLVSGSLLVGWLLVEAIGAVGLIDYPNRFGTTAIWERPDNRHDPEMQFVRKPNLELAGTMRGNIAEYFRLEEYAPHRYELEYDRNGFRNSADYDRADVVVVGDSYIEGILVPEPQTFTSVLASRTGLDVVNLGLTGYGPRHQLAALERVGLPLRPDVVVWAFYEGNDIAGLHAYDVWVREGRPRRRQSLLAGSFLSAALGAGVDLLQRRDPQAHRQLGIFRLAAGGDIPVYFLEPPPESSPEGRMEELRGVFEAAHTATRSTGARLVVLFVPTKFRAYRRAVTLPPDSSLLTWGGHEFPERIRELLATVSEEIGFLDLTPLLNAEAQAGTMVYFADDTHWTAEGHRLVADIAAPVVSAASLE